MSTASYICDCRVGGGGVAGATCARLGREEVGGRYTGGQRTGYPGFSSGCVCCAGISRKIQWAYLYSCGMESVLPGVFVFVGVLVWRLFCFLCCVVTFFSFFFLVKPS